MLAYSQWLAQHAADKLDDKATRMLQTIEMNGEHMHGLLGALRQYIFRQRVDGRADEDGRHQPGAAWTALFNVESLVQETRATIEAQ